MKILDDKELSYLIAKDYGNIDAINKFITKYNNDNRTKELKFYKNQIIFLNKVFSEFYNIEFTKLKKINLITNIIFTIIQIYILFFYNKIPKLDYDDKIFLSFIIIIFLIGIIPINIFFSNILKSIIVFFKFYSPTLNIIYLYNTKKDFNIICLNKIKNDYNKLCKTHILKIKYYLYNLLSIIFSITFITLFLNIFINYAIYIVVLGFILFFIVLLIYTIMSEQ